MVGVWIARAPLKHSVTQSTAKLPICLLLCGAGARMQLAGPDAAMLARECMRSVPAGSAARGPHSFLPSRSARSGSRLRQAHSRRGSRQITRAELVSPTLFSDVLAPLATLAAPFVDPVSDTLRESFRDAISGSPSAIKPFLILVGTDVLSLLELQPSSATVLRALVSLLCWCRPRDCVFHTDGSETESYTYAITNRALLEIERRLACVLRQLTHAHQELRDQMSLHLASHVVCTSFALTMSMLC